MPPVSAKLKTLFRRSLNMQSSNSDDQAKPHTKSNVAAPHPPTTPAAVLPLTKNPKHDTATRALTGPPRGSGAGPAAYARAVRRYNIDSPVFVGHDGVVFKRAKVHKDAYKRKYRGLNYRKPAADESAADGVTPPKGLGLVAEVPAEDVQNDLEYVVPVKIGTPGVTLNLDFDTGSSDLWVWSSELRAKSAGHTIFNPAKSTTAKPVDGATWSISYGDGSSASGNVYTDTIKIGSLTIPNQAIELAQKLSSSFLQEGGSDGLLGLAWPSINTVQPTSVATPVQNVIDKKLASGVFSVALDQRDNAGFYTFGGIEPAKAGVTLDDITYTAVDNSGGFWLFDSTTAVINGKTMTQRRNTAILDTGTTLCLVSDSLTEAIYKTIAGAKLDELQGGWVYPADATIPTISLAVGDKQYTIRSDNFGFSDAGNGMVFGGIQSRGNNPFDILGDVFLKSIYAVFDQENARIGVAQRTGDVPAAGEA